MSFHLPTWSTPGFEECDSAIYYRTGGNVDNTHLYVLITHPVCIGSVMIFIVAILQDFTWCIIKAKMGERGWETLTSGPHKLWFTYVAPC